MSLGELEAIILGIVTQLGKASARDVLKEILKTKKLAYTSVSTTLDRLYKKGLLRREAKFGRGGQRYIYSPSDDGEVSNRIIDKTLHMLISAFGPSVVASISERLEQISREELAQLKARVEEKRRNVG